MQPQSLMLVLSQLEHEIRRKAFLVTSNLLIETFGGHSAERLARSRERPFVPEELRLNG
jgi:hypothetical protein